MATMSASDLAHAQPGSPDESPRKRRKLDASQQPREPLLDISNTPSLPSVTSNTLAGFVDDDESEDEDQVSGISEPAQSHITPPTSDLPRVDGFEDMDTQDKDDLPTETLSPIPGPTFSSGFPKVLASAKTCSGQSVTIKQRQRSKDVFYGDLVAAKSKNPTDRAQRNFYGIDIHRLMDDGKAAMELAANKPEAIQVVPSVEAQPEQNGQQPRRMHMWTEKYRARNFTDLLGDERTHRSVLHWFKSWDKIVFPGASKPKLKLGKQREEQQEDQQHRKILLLTGPPGLGKTTLAHICARQAGYETKEINASDERSKDVVNGRIRDMVGTENVRSLDAKDAKKSARPLCIIVDEADGVVSGSSYGGGEGGFIKALIDLIALDQRNSSGAASSATTRRKKKGDKFRLLRPVVLICNDVYHPSLRPLRQSLMAETIHVRRPALNSVIPRLSSIFAREGIKADNDGVRTLCEAAWGVTSRKKGGAGSEGGGGTTEGDIRSVLVIGEWVASRLRCSSIDLQTAEPERLTRKWIEQHVIGELGHNGSAARSLGRGGGKECVARVFAYNAGFTSASRTSKVTEDRLGTGGPTDAARKANYDRLKGMVDASGEEDRIVQDVFTQWPTQPFQDTTTLTKPCAAADWLHFSSLINHRVHTSQEWDLMAYSAYPVLALHSLFAATSPASHAASMPADASALETKTTDPFATSRPDLTALELTKQHSATLSELHGTLSLALRRAFPTPTSTATDLLPYTLRILNPAASPTLIGGQASLRRAPERERVNRAANAMRACGVRFESARIETSSSEAGLTPGLASGNAGRVLRMNPPLDEAGSFLTLDETRTGRAGGDAGRARFALRAVLEAAFQTQTAKGEAEARLRRGGGAVEKTEKENHEMETKALKKMSGIKRDFFGREITAVTAAGDAVAAGDGEALGAKKARKEVRGRSAVWVTFHEGFSNAVRKPITMRELLDGL